MDIREILNGIQHFYETIIPKAFCSPDWNEENIMNAFLWVKFCEEVYVKCTGKNAEKLDCLLHSISNELKSFYQTSLCFQDLQRSRTLLTQAFFENPNVENTKIETVFQKEQLEPDIFTKALHDGVAVDTLCYDLIESLRLVSISNSDRSFYYEIKSELFLDYLKNTLEHLSTDDQEFHLTSAFEALIKNDESLMILFHVLLHSSRDDDNETSEVQQFCVNWILLKLYSDKNSSLAHFLLNQSPTKLRTLATRYEAFYGYYLETITKCADSLREADECGIQTWKSGPSTSTELSLSYDQVLNHIRSLISIDDKVGKSTQEHISVLLNTHAEKLVWKEIASHFPALEK